MITKDKKNYSILNKKNNKKTDKIMEITKNNKIK